MIRDLDLDDVPDRVRSLLDDLSGSQEMSEAMLRVARPDAAEEIAEGLIALAALEGRRIWFVGIGGAGLSAYAQLARAWGAEVGGWDRCERRISSRSTASRSRSRPSRSCRTDGRWSSRPRIRTFPARRAPSSSPSSSPLRRSIVVARVARKGNDGGDDRVRPPRDRARPRLADRRADPPARQQRRRGGGMARRRGRRVRPLGLRPAGRDRRRDERRARPPQRVRLARRAGGRVRRAGPARRRARRSRRAAVRGRARAARRAQPRERGRGAGRARARRRRRGTRRRRARALHGDRPPLRGVRGAAA